MGVDERIKEIVEPRALLPLSNPHENGNKLESQQRCTGLDAGLHTPFVIAFTQNHLGKRERGMVQLFTERA